ncbi:hypothetical protein [Thiomonas sp. FB-Cd]|uniref:hypothetical protein n=1 Tax=Thiomonas sp. FB-Cd TaxID=1158292 RepID=UPI0004DF86BD|nr:hypothetical protein [Thiomonas sp. FB-Cd]
MFSDLNLVSSTTLAYACRGCHRIVHRVVEDWHHPLGASNCFGGPYMHHRVELRRSCPHPFDHLLDPDNNPEDRSVHFTTVLCEDCYSRNRKSYEANRQFLDEWMAVYAHLLAQVDRWCQTVVPVFQGCIENAISEFNVDDLPRILGAEECLALASRRETRNRRDERLRRVLDARQATLEAYITSGFQLDSLWDSQPFQQARNAAYQKAGVFTMLGPVGIATPLQPPKVSEYTVIRAPGSPLGSRPEEAIPGPALWDYREFDIIALLTAADEQVKLPSTDDAVSRLRKKCYELAKAKFLVLK